jgi:serine/threonine-protein kinase
MVLAPQMRLGSYEILAPLGAGGMGEVYRARDTRLGREVALKLLKPDFASDAERMARFEREAQLLAQLNHPGIATIHGLEQEGSRRALVMELVPGPTLGERIARSAVPLEEALPLARQIAEALEYAHERGIVHRDLKPANVKLTEDGSVKVLDFGLAKALASDGASADTSLAGASQSPTLSAMATGLGVILGTAAYMSPEQAKGRPADRRADVWSFGVVLYEMLSGKRMWSGETPAETLAAMLKTDPDWSALPAGIPESLKRLLHRCLEKDARRRVQAIGEARIAIEDVLSGAPEEPVALREPGRPWPWLVAGAALALALGLSAPWRAAPPAKPPLRLSVELGVDAVLPPTIGPAAALSPDGSTLVFVAARPGAPAQLYIRRLDQESASPLAGTANGSDPFFSPDGRSIAFFADGKLKKVATTGGVPFTLCDAPANRGGTWAEDGTIVFTPSGGPASALYRVSSQGGAPEPLAGADGTGRALGRWPQALPGGRAVLYTASSAGSFEEASLVVQPLPNGPATVVHRGGYHGRYVRSGHLVYVSKGTLFAAPFNLARLELVAPPVPAIEGIIGSASSAGAQLALSDDGTLAYLPGRGTGGDAPIQWLDAHGRTTLLRAAPTDAINIRFSPDGRHLAMDVSDGGQARDVWVYDWERETMSRLTSDGANDSDPLWSPDGRRIVFASRRAGSTENLYWQRADGTGEAQRLTESRNTQGPGAWHPDGRTLVFVENDPKTGNDLMVLPLEGEETTGFKPGTPRAFLNSPFNEATAAFSPDGRFLAYRSTETGRSEVYVRPFPGPGDKWQVSTEGGVLPVWSRTRPELFYRSATDHRLMVAAYTVEGSAFRPGKPRLWSDTPFEIRGSNRTFDLHPDGRRVAVLKAPAAEAKRDHLTLVLGFADELRRIAPPR